MHAIDRQIIFICVYLEVNDVVTLVLSEYTHSFSCFIGAFSSVIDIDQSGQIFCKK